MNAIDTSTSTPKRADPSDSPVAGKVAAAQPAAASPTRARSIANARRELRLAAQFAAVPPGV